MKLGRRRLIGLLLPVYFSWVTEPVTSVKVVVAEVYPEADAVSVGAPWEVSL